MAPCAELCYSAPMNERVKRLSEEIRKLAPEERADLMDELVVLSALDADPAVDQSWLNEVNRRADAYDAGRDVGVDAEQLISGARAALARRRGV